MNELESASESESEIRLSGRQADRAGPLGGWKLEAELLEVLIGRSVIFVVVIIDSACIFLLFWLHCFLMECTFSSVLPQCLKELEADSNEEVSQARVLLMCFFQSLVFSPYSSRLVCEQVPRAVSWGTYSGCTQCGAQWHQGCINGLPKWPGNGWWNILSTHPVYYDHLLQVPIPLSVLFLFNLFLRHLRSRQEHMLCSGSNQTLC